MNIDFQEILFLLSPQSGNIAFTILLYLLFFGSLYILLRMPDKNMVPTLLIAAVLLSIVISKLNISATGSSVIFPPDGFIQFTLNAVIFTFPLLIAGTVRARKKGVVVGPAIIIGVLGGVYFFSFWFFNQRAA